MVTPSPARKPSQPYRTGVPQVWSGDLIEASHEEALYAYGEYVMYTLMWRPADYEAGLVEHCTTCWDVTQQSRQAEAFAQPTKSKCPDCYGTTFEGGFRAQIIRPTLMADRNSEVDEDRQGVVVTDTISVETTSDFTLHKGDYLFRFDNARYQVEEKNEAIVRTGFSPPYSPDSFAGNTVAHLEDETSVAYLIPPIDPEVISALLSAQGSQTVPDLDAYSTVRPNGYLLDGDPAPAQQGPAYGDILTGHGPPPSTLVVPEGTKYLDLDSGDLYASSGA